ncbi:MAG TPA: PA14 domain-containing protein [Methanocella sp.]|uniref:PA14 domain-containing protein n=1 Tax=Methanocella sp. TaxID=2052833 RepID=UPI002B821EAD|nr:PA14 domain-containing protein [Methanocella sp.]HTY89706.1 PA14 domain-containing protein [Methanocella sp.]
MDDQGVADAFYTVLSIGIVLVAALAVSGVVLSTTSRQGGEAAAQLAGYGDSGLSKGLYCFYYAADSGHSDFTSGDSEDIVFKSLALERTDYSIALNSSSVPASAPSTLGMALWSGYLYVPQAGSYTLELESSSQAWLWIDGDLAADNKKPDNPQSKTFTLTLTKGNHPMKLKFFYPDIGKASCSLKWQHGGAFVPVTSFNR